MDYEWYLASSDRLPETYPVLSFDGIRRLLVLAPHCDDEILGAGGLIQAALRRGIDVRVAIVTACDGYPRATMTESRHLFPTSTDFIVLGERRQQESLAALIGLGLDPDAVVFLTYPERGLTALWWDHWDGDHPYCSPYSERTYNLCPHAFHPDAPYSGEALLGDLRAILALERPDLIIAPHPDDEHPDHQTLSAFVALAVEMERAEDPTFHPSLLGYLVHYGLYPQPFGLKPQLNLRPPRQLLTVGEWQQWRLSIHELAAKREALNLYPSQLQVLSPFLYSFVRQNELYMRVDTATMLDIVEGETFPDADSVPAVPANVTLPEHADPVSDSVVRRIYGGADITGLRVLRLGNDLWVALDLRARVIPVCSYRLYVRAITPEGSVNWSGHYGRTRTDGVEAHGQTIWFRLNLDALGHPNWLVLAAKTYQGVILDYTAWYLLRL